MRFLHDENSAVPSPLGQATAGSTEQGRGQGRAGESLDAHKSGVQLWVVALPRLTQISVPNLGDDVKDACLPSSPWNSGSSPCGICTSAHLGLYAVFLAS